jgi:hypothetical protein
MELRNIQNRSDHEREVAKMMKEKMMQIRCKVGEDRLIIEQFKP